MKVQIFSGRKHHWLKLKNIYHELEERGHEAQFIIANNAINIDPSSEYLLKTPYKHVHVYNYVQNLDEFVPSYSSDFFRLVPPFWGFYSARELNEVYNGLKNMWQKDGKPDCFLILHENNFWTKLIAFLCKENGIPCFSFQEGLLRHRDQDTMNKQALAAEYSSGLFVWTDSDKTAYELAGIDSEKIYVAGCLHLDKKYFPNVTHPRHKQVLLALSSYSEYIGDMYNDVISINDWCITNGLKLVVRFHPFEKHLVKSFPDNIAFDLDDDPLPSILTSRLVMGQHSTIVLEAVFLGVPAVEYNFDKTKLLTEPLYNMGLTDAILSYEELSKIGQIVNYGISDVKVNEVNKIKVPLNGVVKNIVKTIEERVNG